MWLLEIIEVPIALGLVLVCVFLPWKLRVRMIRGLRKVLDFSVAKSRNATNFIMNKANRSRSIFKAEDPGPDFQPEEDFPADCDGQEVSLMFSGGSDSTLAAILLCERFKKVHLLTFSFWPLVGFEGARRTGEKLIAKFGPDKVCHEFVSIEDIFQEIYHKSYWKDFRKFHLFVENICAYCKLAMLYRVLIYNIQNDVKYAATGASYEGAPFFAEQMPKGSEAVNELFAKYGKALFSPVFHVKRTDHELYRLGFTEEKEKKFPAAGFDDHQASCDLGVIHHIYSQAYFVPCFGLEKLAKKSCDFIRHKNARFEELMKKYPEPPAGDPFPRAV